MAVSVTDITTIRRLIAVGNNELFFEDINVSAGTMIELAAATGDIDTSDQLIGFESYQKGFVINGANLKIADFGNVKLTHTALGTAHAKGDLLTQAVSAATMSVDFTNTAKTATYGHVVSGTFNVTNSITGSGSGNAFTPTGIDGALTHTVLGTAHTSGDTLTQANTSATMVVEYTDVAKTHTYGRITGGTFNTTDTVSGDGAGSVFTPTTVDTSPPLWYDYTVYPGGASGSLPAKAYLGAPWRGRIVLSGNPDLPNQWYMSRVTDPFDYAYVANDAGSPIAGGEDPSTPGQVGDIVRALIPLGQDYLIFGCATSMWMMSGDPAEGGSLNTIDETVGIFGANSWCLDGFDNLYFWGTGGIYKIAMQGGAATVDNLTRISLPKLIGDEAADPSTHRVTMEYDREEHGALICITKLSDGTNSNYFYSFNPVAEGLYPESYPEECGAYSLFYYAANDTSNIALLVGCKDGYIRRFDPSAKSDDIGGTDEAISSYVTFGPLKLASDGREGVIHSLEAFISGGSSGGTEADSDDIAYKIFAGRSAGDVAEKIVANTNPRISGTLSAPGRPRGSMKKRKVRGVFAGIRLENITAGETMSFDRLLVNGKQRGRIK